MGDSAGTKSNPKIVVIPPDLRRSRRLTGKHVGDGYGAKGLTIDEKLEGIEFVEDHGRWINPAHRIRVDLDLTIGQIDDPVKCDTRPGVDITLLAAVSGQAAVRDLDEEGDLPGTGMACGVFIDITPDHGEIGLGLIVVRNPDRTFTTDMPARRDRFVDRASTKFRGHCVFRILRQLPNQNAIEELDRLIFADRPGVDHPLIEVDRDPVYVRWRWQRQESGRLCRGQRAHSVPLVSASHSFHLNIVAFPDHPWVFLAGSESLIKS